jgi:tetratricopeptide (TPR) repeat protein
VENPDKNTTVIMLDRECRSFSSYLLVFAIAVSGILAAGCGSSATYIAKGEEYLAKRKFHDAMIQFRSAADYDGGSAKAHWGLARAYENLGQFNETVDELRKTVELDGTNLEAKAKLGTYFLLVQPPLIDEAEKLRSEIMDADERSIDGQLLTASIMAAQGKPDNEIIDAVERAIGFGPERIDGYIALQRLYMTRENAPQAEAAIKRGVAANPASAKGHTEYGRFLSYLNRDSEAETTFLTAISNDASDIESREALAEFYVLSRQMEKAERAHLDLVAIQENSPESRLELADFYSKAGRDDDAITTLNGIISDAPDYARARYRIGQMFLDRREVPAVYEQVNHLLKINDQDTEALMLKARTLLYENKPDEAVKDVETVLKRLPSNRQALFLMAQARLAAGQVDQANAFISDLERYHPTYVRAGLLRVQSAFTSGDLQGAFRLSNELISKATAALPNAELDAQGLQDLRLRGISSRGLAALQLGRLAEAKADLQEVVRLSPRSSTARVNLAKALAASNDQAGALELYEAALIIDPQNFDSISGIVNSLIKLGQHPKARSRIEALTLDHAGRSDMLAGLHYLRSTVHHSQRELAAAEADLLKAIELDENYFPAYSAYASLLIEQKRSSEAIAQYKKVLDKRPSAQIYTMLGIVEDSVGNTSGAEAAYRKALEMQPETAIAANNLAWLITENQGNLDEALQLATMAASRSQGTPGFHDTLGWVYFRKGLASPAVEQLRKAVALDDANAQKNGTKPNAGYRVRLGMALAKSGDKASARREVETSLRSMDRLTQREIVDARNVLSSL